MHVLYGLSVCKKHNNNNNNNNNCLKSNIQCIEIRVQSYLYYYIMIIISYTNHIDRNFSVSCKQWNMMLITVHSNLFFSFGLIIKLNITYKCIPEAT